MPTCRPIIASCHTYTGMTALPMDPRQMEKLPTVMIRQPQTMRKNSRGHRHTPKHCSNSTPQRPNTTQNNGSTILLSALWSDEACTTRSRFSVWGSVHPRQKSRYTTGSSRANTTQTKMTVSPLDSQWKKQQNFSNCSTMQINT